MSPIKQNLNQLKSLIPEGVTLVAVSKTKPVIDILEAYNCGQRIFGENRTQEILSKKDLLPGDINWHLIGHLQTNKVKYLIPFISMIQSVDSFKLLKVINHEASKIDRIVDCLLQFYIATEETKFGFDLEEVRAMIETDEFKSLKNVRICGVMGMATYSDNTDQIRNEFKSLLSYFRELKSAYFVENKYFNEISMGMSGDFRIAIEEGSTMVRIGSVIFGERQKLN